MTITVPDEWAARFAVFDHAEALLRGLYRSPTGPGVSRHQVMVTFAAYCGVTSVWRDPVFHVWAGLRGCTQSQDFLDRWDDDASEAG